MDQAAIPLPVPFAGSDKSVLRLDLGKYPYAVVGAYGQVRTIASEAKLLLVTPSEKGTQYWR